MTTAKILKRGYRKYKKQIFILVLLGLLSGLFEGLGITALIPVFSQLTGYGESNDFISRFIGWFLGLFSSGAGLRALLSFIIIAFVLKAVLLVISHYISAKISGDYEKETRRALLEDTLGARWSFLLSGKSGYLEAALIKDIDMSRALFLHLGTAILTLTSLIMYAFIAFSISPVITLLSLGLGGVILFILKPFTYKIRDLSRSAAHTNSMMAHHVSESIAGLKSVKAGAIEGRVSKRAAGYFDLLRNANLKVALLNIIASVFVEPISVIFVVGVFAFSYLSGDFQIGVFAATIYLIQRIFKQIQNVQATIYRINERAPYLQKIIDFQDKIADYQELNTGSKPFRFNDSLEFQNVSFSYAKDEKAILSDFTFSVKNGEMVGIIGESGAGKTTIADLLLRLFNLSGGKILIDGEDIEDMDLRDLRKNIGYVSQDIFIRDDSIENNIRFYDEAISDSDVVYGAKMAYIYDFVKSQPGGFRAQVGDRGVLLSGGEKQRLALARQLARYPKILILDEATSSLDNRSESMIQKAISGMKGKTTMLIIAHRLSTIMDCDKVIFLEGGKIKEAGAPRDLLEDRGSYFYKFYNIR